MLSPIERLDATLKQALLDLSDRPIASAFTLVNAGHGLFPEEAALVASAVAKRTREFGAGRSCARRALAAFGLGPEPLLKGRLGEPIWPSGFSGSITHDGRFAAALAYQSAGGRVWLSIDLIDGGDSETFTAISDALSHRKEVSRRGHGARAIARLFSAKEVAIKIISTATGNSVDFRHINAVENDRGFHAVADNIGIGIAVRTLEVDDVIVSLGLRENF